MAKAKPNPFGMSDADINSLTIVGKKSQKKVTISFQRASNYGNFRCLWCRAYKPSRAVRSQIGNWVCNPCLGLGIDRRSTSATLHDQGGCQPASGNNHRYGVRTLDGTLGCIGCAGFTVMSSSNGQPSATEIKSVLSSIEKRLGAQAKTRKKTLLEKAEPYINSGLAEPFALAIVNGVNDEQVLDLWEADWWKQYEPDDDLILAVLNGEHSEMDARLINEFRGEHPELARACIHKQVTVNWATMLLDSGFEEHPDAVRDVLNGGEPHIVARIRRMKVEAGAIPPGLGEKIKPKTEKGKGPAPTKEEMGSHLHSMSSESWANLFSTHLKGGALDNKTNRVKLSTLFGNDWLVSPGRKGEKKDIKEWATFFNIEGRSKDSTETLRRKVKKKATEVRAFVRADME